MVFKIILGMGSVTCWICMQEYSIDTRHARVLVQ